jgi:hypothetical protein
METLLTAIVLWLSANFDLPANYDHPRIELVPASKISALYYRNFLFADPPAAGTVEIPALQQQDVVAVYDNTTRTIYLPMGWTGTTSGELSILVHEMVHHLQKMAGHKFECPQAREKVAFVAQERWLRMFGSDLQNELGIDPFSLLVKTNCAY